MFYIWFVCPKQTKNEGIFISFLTVGKVYSSVFLCSTMAWQCVVTVGASRWLSVSSTLCQSASRHQDNNNQRAVSCTHSAFLLCHFSLKCSQSLKYSSFPSHICRWLEKCLKVNSIKLKLTKSPRQILLCTWKITSLYSCFLSLNLICIESQS